VRGLVANGETFLAKQRHISAPGSLPIRLLEATQAVPQAQSAFQRDDFAKARQLAQSAVDEIRGSQPNGGHETLQRAFSLYYADMVLVRAEFEQGDYAAAATAAFEALESRKIAGTGAVQDMRDLGEISTWQAASLARQGRLAEAAQIIAPVVKVERELATKNHGDQWLTFELACALYVEALTDTGHRAVLLNEAATLLGKMPPALRSLHDVRRWRVWVQQAHDGVTPRGAG
jgi:hypothetical protein